MSSWLNTPDGEDCLIAGRQSGYENFLNPHLDEISFWAHPDGMNFSRAITSRRSAIGFRAADHDDRMRTDSQGTTHTIPVDSKAAVTVHAVSEAIAPKVINTLSQLAGDFDERVVLQPLRIQLFPGVRDRRWETAWEIVSGTGRTLRLSVRALESEPYAVVVVIDGSPVFHCDLEPGEQVEAAASDAIVAALDDAASSVLNSRQLIAA